MSHALGEGLLTLRRTGRCSTRDESRSNYSSPARGGFPSVPDMNSSSHELGSSCFLAPEVYFLASPAAESRPALTNSNQLETLGAPSVMTCEQLYFHWTKWTKERSFERW